MTPVTDLKHYIRRESNGRAHLEHRPTVGREIIWLAVALLLAAILSSMGPTLDWWLS